MAWLVPAGVVNEVGRAVVPAQDGRMQSLKLLHRNRLSGRVHFPKSSRASRDKYNAAYCPCHFLSTLPALKDLLGSHKPVQRLFADAQPWFPEPPGEVVSPVIVSRLAKPAREEKPGQGHCLPGPACDTGAWRPVAPRGELDVPPYRGGVQSGARPRQRLRGRVPE